MLEKIREGSQGPIVKVILGVIIVAFALTGVNAYLGGSADVYVAKVNGAEISRAEFDRAYQNQRSRMQEQFGEMFDMLAADDAYMGQLRAGALEELIEEKLAVEFAKDLGMQLSADALRDIIRTMPEFQVNGQFNNDVYTRTLMMLGMSSAQFVDYMENQIIRMLALQGALSSEFALPTEVNRFQQLQNERRSGRYAVVTGEQFADQVELSEAEIKAWYENNTERFEVAEQITLQYVELTYQDVLDNVSVTDAEVREYYERNPQAYSTKEERRIAHILFEFGNDENAAKERAEAVLTRLQNGEDFAALAASTSDDVFSGEDGGNLGVLERGSIDPDVEAAGFALQTVGAISGVVRSEFGFHIIQLTDFKPRQQTAFSEVADDIRENLVRVAAETEYFRLQQELARLTFEVPDTLEFAAKDLGLEVKTSATITRANPPARFSHAELLTQAFSPDVKERGLNSELVELDERSMVVRSESYQPAHIRSLEDVKDQVVQTLTAEKAQQMALAEAEVLLERVRNGDIAGINFKYIEAAGRFGAELPGAIRQQLFKMPFSKDAASEVASVALSNGDAAVLELTDVTPGIPDTEMAQQFNSRLANDYTDRAYTSLMQSLKAKAEISRRL
ncbi:SurA N-terminal domain-containing protein [Aliidiomarina quisquiliarum]|uniref:SurA N-terminal domain-containing protein n=1 Tax=Aliidiomarina quisquiliarum TaxID=2938947 RepID=UPI00208F9778|nr:SurA N-terminal domain-containing protein [Aliidiomarina quisquiliarum]MCO4322006.1 SurA N-terminal domain-containing protein [Aliidiomarina quisquiliarum]